MMTAPQQFDVMDPADEIGELERKLKLMSKNQDTRVQMHSQMMEDTKQTMEEVNRENKALKEMLKRLEREHGFGGKTMHEREKDRLETTVFRMRKECDDLEFEIRSLRRQLKGRKDRLIDIKRESEPILTDESPLTQKIRVLENRLDKAMIKYNEAMSIKKTYESILKRLEGERLGFDNQLQAIERTLKAKQSDFVELQNMCHDAKSLRESAKNQLLSATQDFENEKTQKLKELEEKRKYVQARIEMTSTLSRREANRGRSDLDANEDSEGTPKSRTAKYSQAFQGNDPNLEVDQDRLAELEEVWRRLKEVTGVSDVNEVIQKFLSSNDTSKDLQGMTKEAQQKIDNLVWKKAQLKSKLEEIKYSQSTGFGSRRIVDEFEQHLAEARANAERKRAQFERLAKILIDTKAGIDHIMEKLKDIGPKEFDENEYAALRKEDMQPEDAEEEDDEDPAHIAIINQTKFWNMKLGALVQEVGEAIDEEGAGEAVESADDGMHQTTSRLADETSLLSLNISTDHIHVTEHNIRIRLEDDDDLYDDDDDDDDDPTLEPSTRERIKQIAANEHSKHTKTSKKKKIRRARR